jgi:hypothetical protein
VNREIIVFILAPKKSKFEGIINRIYTTRDC